MENYFLQSKCLEFEIYLCVQAKLHGIHEKLIGSPMIRKLKKTNQNFKIDI